MKKMFKKSLAILLVATSFNFLSMIGKASCNILTYADTEATSAKGVEETAVGNDTEQDEEETAVESEPENQDSEETTVKDDSEQDEEKPAAEKDAEQAQEKTTTESENEQRQDIETVRPATFFFKKFVHYKGTPFYFDASLEDAYNHSKEELDKIYKDDKDKIKLTLVLDYPDDLEVPIYVHYFNDTICGQFCRSYIQIKPKYLSDHEILPHEMPHALLHHILGEKLYRELNRGLDEGFATQNDSLDSWRVELPKQNKCFATSCM